jgi:hypothetical protein
VSTIPAKQIERNRDESCRRDHVRALSANYSSGGHHDPKAVLHLCVNRDGEQVASIDYYPRKTHRRQECAIVFNIDATAQPSVARSVRKCADRFKVRREDDRRFLPVTKLPNSCGNNPAATSASC